MKPLWFWQQWEAGNRSWTISFVDSTSWFEPEGAGWIIEYNRAGELCSLNFPKNWQVICCGEPH